MGVYRCLLLMLNIKKNDELWIHVVTTVYISQFC